jgi:AsmA-like C-terminal region/AsmA family
VKRLALWAFVVVAAVAVLAIAAAIALPYAVDTPRVQTLIASSASHALGRPVTFSSLSVRLLPLPAVALHDLQIAEDPRFGPGPFVKLDRGDVRLRIRPLLAGRVEFGDVVLKKALISVVKDATGRWNFATLGGSPPSENRPPAAPGRHRGSTASGAGTASVLGSRVKIEDAVLSYVSRTGAGVASNYRLEHVDVTLAGAPGSIAVEAAARVKPGDLAVKLSDGAIALEGAHSVAEAQLRGRLALDGKDVKDLVAAAVGLSPAISGGFKGTLTLGGTVGSPRASGPVELSAPTVTQRMLRCPEPKQRTLRLGDVKVNAAWQELELTGRPVTTSIGKGTIATTLTATLEHGVQVDLRDIAVTAVPLETVLVDFLCQGYAVTGPLDLTGGLGLNLRNMWTSLSGSGQLRIGPGKVVGSQALALLGGVTRLGGAVSSLLATEVPQGLQGSPLEFESITGTFQARNGVVTTHDLLYTSRAMKVAVSGDYALGPGTMKLDVVVNHGRGEVQAKVTGTAASPSVRLVPSSVVRGLDTGQVESGLRDLLKRFR